MTGFLSYIFDCRHRSISSVGNVVLLSLKKKTTTTTRFIGPSLDVIQRQGYKVNIWKMCFCSQRNNIHVLAWFLIVE